MKRLIAGILLGIALGLGPLPVAAADDSDLVAEATKALDTVFKALAEGDLDKVRPLLAPEFQVQRSDGRGFEKESYLAIKSIPAVTRLPTYRDMVVTRNGDIVVARFLIDIEETIGGRRAELVSPQLFVFRVTGDGWQVVASANFARLN